jgi:ribosomal protein L7/L12
MVRHSPLILPFINQLNGVSMSIRITNDRPKVMWQPDDSAYADELIGTSSDWDWLFRGELAGKTIASIKLLRQLNPGLGLRDARDAYEASDKFRS